MFVCFFVCFRFWQCHFNHIRICQGGNNQEKQKLIISPPPKQIIIQQIQPQPQKQSSSLKWIIIISFFIICAGAITLYIYFNNKDLCKEYNQALTNYNNSLVKYNNFNSGDNINLTEEQLNYKISYLKACQGLYESVFDYKGMYKPNDTNGGTTSLKILRDLQNGPDLFINENYKNAQEILEWKKKLTQWDLYNSKGCNDLVNINITIYILLTIALLFFTIFTIRKKIIDIKNFNYSKISILVIFVIFVIFGIPFITYRSLN